MKTRIFLATLFLPLLLQAQDTSNFTFKGQASLWANSNFNEDEPIRFGARYLPQMNYTIELSNNQLIDFEASANIYGSLGYRPNEDWSSNDEIVRPYRGWVRWSGNQFELRAGLQKINFGSAMMLRPLMWFDQVDPRDPLQLTDGVWAILGRYYFLNNANIWLWGLYGNEGPKTWELGQTLKKTPEFGGRVQLPIPMGETGFSFHHRTVDTQPFMHILTPYQQIPESRYGFDAKWDVEVGLWMEATWIQKHKDWGSATNQHLFNLGTDYTFGIGNGLNIVAEHLVFATAASPFEFENTIHFSGASLSYPLGMFDNISAIVYYDWTNENAYNFINWKKDLNQLSFYLMAFWNPETFQLPQQNQGAEMFAGRGLQVMVVWNH